MNGIYIKGGHGVSRNGRIIGGGLLLDEGATVSLENYTRVSENICYFDSSMVSGAGAGVYISNKAKLYVNTGAVISDNVGTHYGAGVYVANGGYLRTQKSSGSHIQHNSFNESFAPSGNAVQPLGGGVYLDEHAVFEMFGCYVNENSVNTTNENGGLGSGIYVSDNAELKMKGSAQITIPNDVYLKNNVQVEIQDSVDGKPNARFTPENYPVDGGADVYLLKLNQETASSSLLWNNITGHFEITPQTISNGDKQYWHFDSTATTGEGKMIKQTGASLSVSIASSLPGDIEVSVTSGGSAVDNTMHLTGGAQIEFTATVDMSNYEWTVDGETQSNTTNLLTLDTSSWKPGVYEVYLEAKDSDGNYYSYTAQIKVSQD